MFSDMNVQSIQTLLYVISFLSEVSIQSSELYDNKVKVYFGHSEFPYSQSSSDLEVGVRHLEASWEYPHQDDGCWEHEEGEDDVNPEVHGLLCLVGTQVGQGGVAKLCGVTKLGPLEIEGQHQA